MKEFKLDLDKDDNPRITKKWLNKFLHSDFKQYYLTPYLNDVLYLHYNGKFLDFSYRLFNWFVGFTRIENLQEFTGLKVLYLNENAIEKIEGLEKLRNLRSLYLHSNCIKTIEGLDHLNCLRNLNLSCNMIEKIQNLSKLRLDNL